MQQHSDNSKVQKPSIFHSMGEGRTVFELGMSTALMPWLLLAPRGDGHPIMVIPGFLANDMTTKPLRSYLKIKGYQSHGWGLGTNLGTEIVGGENIISDSLLNRVVDLSAKYDKKISLIGWSLGGVLAREVARAAPDCVRQVFSLGKRN